MGQDNSKKMLFEAMHKVTGMPLNEDYQDYLDTHYSADGLEDYNALKEIEQEAEALYDAGKQLYLQGRKQEAEEKRQEALKKGFYLDWDETELPPYGGLNEENQQEGETYDSSKKFELSNEINALKKKYMETMTPFDFFNGIILGLGVGGGINNDDYSKEVRQHLKENTPLN